MKSKYLIDLCRELYLKDIEERHRLRGDVRGWKLILSVTNQHLRSQTAVKCSKSRNHWCFLLNPNSLELQCDILEL